MQNQGKPHVSCQKLATPKENNILSHKKLATTLASTLAVAKLAKAKLAKAKLATPKLPSITKLTKSLFGVLAPVSFL